MFCRIDGFRLRENEVMSSLYLENCRICNSKISKVVTYNGFLCKTLPLFWVFHEKKKTSLRNFTKSFQIHNSYRPISEISKIINRKIAFFVRIKRLRMPVSFSPFFHPTILNYPDSDDSPIQANVTRSFLFSFSLRGFPRLQTRRICLSGKERIPSVRVVSHVGQTAALATVKLHGNGH